MRENISGKRRENRQVRNMQGRIQKESWVTGTCLGLEILVLYFLRFKLTLFFSILEFMYLAQFKSIFGNAWSVCTMGMCHVLIAWCSSNTYTSEEFWMRYQIERRVLKERTLLNLLFFAVFCFCVFWVFFLIFIFKLLTVFGSFLQKSVIMEIFSLN